MKFLADENLDAPIVNRLRQDGHFVLYVMELEPGISDDDVLDIASKEGCLLITSDKDFGELVFRLQRITAGVILVRLAGTLLDVKVEIISRAIATYAEQLSCAFTVISRSSIRIRKLL